MKCSDTSVYSNRFSCNHDYYHDISNDKLSRQLIDESKIEGKIIGNNNSINIESREIVWYIWNNWKERYQISWHLWSRTERVYIDSKNNYRVAHRPTLYLTTETPRSKFGWFRNPCLKFARIFHDSRNSEAREINGTCICSRLNSNRELGCSSSKVTSFRLHPCARIADTTITISKSWWLRQRHKFRLIAASGGGGRRGVEMGVRSRLPCATCCALVENLVNDETSWNC